MRVITAFYHSILDWVEFRHPIAALYLAVIASGILFFVFGLLWFLCII